MKSGLKQDCILSTLLFKLYLNDLSEVLSTTNKGIVVDNTYIHVNHLCYADDLILVAETEHDLQHLLNILSNWCNEYCMTINVNKTKAVPFRNKSVARSSFQLKCGESPIEYTDKCIQVFGSCLKRTFGLHLTKFLIGHLTFYANLGSKNR